FEDQSTICTQGRRTRLLGRPSMVATCSRTGTGRADSGSFDRWQLALPLDPEFVGGRSGLRRTPRHHFPGRAFAFSHEHTIEGTNCIRTVGGAHSPNSRCRGGRHLGAGGIKSWAERGPLLGWFAAACIPGADSSGDLLSDWSRVHPHDENTA